MDLPLDLSIKKSTSPARNGVTMETGYDPSFGDCPSSVIVPEDVASDVTRQHGDIRVSLLDANVWKAFSSKGTEMIINRGGRRMFPQVTIAVSGLSASGLYNLWLDIVPADDRRYKYVQNAWVPVSQADPSHPSTPYLHPDSPNTGSFWMQKKVSFARLKLTNNMDSSEGNILLQSMHKYKARIHIAETGINGLDTASASFSFDETAFIAVTAYQNGSITKLKIHNNPFAKAFRDKHLSLNQTRNRVSSNSSQEGEQDTRRICRKRKKSESDDSVRSGSNGSVGSGSNGSSESGSSGSVGTSANFRHALQLATSSAMLTSSPWGFRSDASAIPYTSPVYCNPTGLSPLYRPWRHVSQHAVWSVAPLMFPSPSLLSANYSTSRALCSTTSSLPYYRTVTRCHDKPS